MTHKGRLYLDYAATTPPAPEIVQIWKNSLNIFGNPSSIHSEGSAARVAINQSRRKISSLFQVPEECVVFTSGVSEANHLAFFKAWKRFKSKNPTISNPNVIISPLEHPSIKRSAEQLGELFGVVMKVYAIDGNGQPDLDKLDQMIDGQTMLIAVSAVTSETGIIQPIADIHSLASSKGVPLHVDAAQAFRDNSFFDFLGNFNTISISGHKAFAPRGIGALISFREMDQGGVIQGGDQENGHRAGTENTSGSMALAAAMEFAFETVRETPDWSKNIEERLIVFPGARIIGTGAKRAKNFSSIYFPDVDAQKLVIALDLNGIAISAGSACAVGNRKPSTALMALGLSALQASQVVRITPGRLDYMDSDSMENLVSLMIKLASKFTAK